MNATDSTRETVATAAGVSLIALGCVQLVYSVLLFVSWIAVVGLGLSWFMIRSVATPGDSDFPEMEPGRAFIGWAMTAASTGVLATIAAIFAGIQLVRRANAVHGLVALVLTTTPLSFAHFSAGYTIAGMIYLAIAAASCGGVAMLRSEHPKAEPSPTHEVREAGRPGIDSDD